MSCEWSCNCPDFAQNMHDQHQEAKHTSLFCLVFLRPSLGVRRPISRLSTEGESSSLLSKDTPCLFNPHKNFFLQIPRVHIPLSWKLLPWKMLKAQDPRSKVTVGWHQAAARQWKAQQLLYAPLHLKCSSREPCTFRDFSDKTGAPTGNYQLENPPQLCSMWQGAKDKHVTAVELQRELCEAQFFGGNKSGLSHVHSDRGADAKNWVHFLWELATNCSFTIFTCSALTSTASKILCWKCFSDCHQVAST